MSINNFSYTFKAKLGNNLQNIISREFSDNQQKMNKYNILLNETYKNVVDENTVIDINKEGYYVLSNDTFNGITRVLDSKAYLGNSFAETILTECPRTLGYGENLLFKKITRTMIEKKNDQNLRDIVNSKITNVKINEKFNHIITCAERIKSENPNSKFTDIDFEIMENVILQEEADTPGTEAYNLIHSKFFLK